MSTARKLFLLLGVVALAALEGCASPQAGRDQAALTAVQWELVKWSLQPMPPVGVRPIMLRFDQRGDEGRVSGHAGCNQFSAPYVLRDPGEITIATPVATRMACAPEVMEFEARLLDKLESISAYKITGKNMDLTAADGHVLSFRARAKVGAEANIKFIYVAPRQVACATGAAQNQSQPPWLVFVFPNLIAQGRRYCRLRFRTGHRLSSADTGRACGAAGSRRCQMDARSDRRAGNHRSPTKIMRHS